MNQPFPSFFIIGAQKAGTTTLHHWLASQPGVSLPGRKETHFFSHDERYALGRAWYLNQFSRGIEGTTYGEVDPEYLFFKSAGDRIFELGGTPRFIVIVREPLHRAYSHYCMSRRRGLEKFTFAKALASEERRLATGQLQHLKHHSYMARSLYTRQIARYQNIFGSAAILVLTFDDLFDQKNSFLVFKRLCKFIGLSSFQPPEKKDQKYNTASVPHFQFINNLLWRKEKWKSLRSVVRWLLPFRNLKYRMGRTLDTFNQRNAFKHPLPLASIDPHFVRVANQETRRLSETTGLDLTHWIRKQDH